MYMYFRWILEFFSKFVNLNSWIRNVFGDSSKKWDSSQRIQYRRFGAPKSILEPKRWYWIHLELSCFLLLGTIEPPKCMYWQGMILMKIYLHNVKIFDLVIFFLRFFTVFFKITWTNISEKVTLWPWNHQPDAHWKIHGYKKDKTPVDGPYENY